MTVKTIELKIIFPDEVYNKLMEILKDSDSNGCYENNIDEYLHDITDFRIMKHILENAELMRDFDKHFCRCIQT